MSCPGWEADVVERARGGAARAGLETHLTACARCAARLAEERALSAALAQAAAADAGAGPPPAVEAQVLARVRRPRAPRRRLLLAAAAALVAAALPLLRPAVPAAVDAPRAPFRVLPGAEPLRPGEAAHLVRVGLSASALQSLGWPVELEAGGLVETELILGADGTARAMRLASARGHRPGARAWTRGGGR